MGNVPIAFQMGFERSLGWPDEQRLAGAGEGFHETHCCLLLPKVGPALDNISDIFLF